MVPSAKLRRRCELPGSGTARWWPHSAAPPRPALPRSAISAPFLLIATAPVWLTDAARSQPPIPRHRPTGLRPDPQYPNSSTMLALATPDRELNVHRAVSVGGAAASPTSLVCCNARLGTRQDERPSRSTFRGALEQFLECFLRTSLREKTS